MNALEFRPCYKFQYTPPTPKPFQIYRCDFGLYIDLRQFFERVGVSRRSVSEWVDRFKAAFPDDSTTFLQSAEGGTWYCNLETLDRVLISQPKSGRAARFAIERLADEWKTSATRARFLQETNKTSAPLVALFEEPDEAPAIERVETPPRKKSADNVKKSAAPADAAPAPTASFSLPNVPDVNFTV